MTTDGNQPVDRDDVPPDVRVPATWGPRRRRRGRIGSLLTGMFAICLIGLFVVGAGFFYIKTTFEKAGPLETAATILIERGQGTRTIAERLFEEGAISDDKVFLLGLLAHRADGKLKAGEYRIEANASMRQVMDLLVAGKSIQYKITVPEGLTTMQVLNRVEAHEVLLGEIEGEVPEGSLLPDTYTFTRGTTRQQMVERMQAALSKLLDHTWPGRDQTLPLNNPYEAVILASIVEKETALASERGRVASVFVNRLRQGMRLQSDPTIVYGIVGGKGALDRPIRKSDISERTSYNTYQIDGLPPTPIANPGKAAIEAVLNPPETKDLFFVADGTGGHAFSETLAGHNDNVRRWREIERARRDAAPDDEPEPEPAAAEAEPDDSAAESEQTAALDPQSGDADTAQTEPQGAPELAETPDAAIEPDPVVEPEPSDVQADQNDTDTSTATLETAATPEPDQEPAASPELTDLEPDTDAAQDLDAQQPPVPQVDQNNDDPSEPDAAQQQIASQTPPDDTAAFEPAQEPDPAPEPAPQVDSAPTPSPKPELPVLNDIARSIIEKAPRPKPKPARPQSAIIAPPEPPADADAPVSLTPLPDATPAVQAEPQPAVQPPLPDPTPARRPAPQAPSTSDLR